MLQITKMSRDRIQREIEYELKIDTQVEKYFETKHKLTYFLITASVAIVAFLVNFAITHIWETIKFIYLVIPSISFGIIASGFALFNLYFENRSYRLHIEYRYKKKKWKSLTKKEQNEWDKINKWAYGCLISVFIFLFVEIFFAVVFFIFVFIF
jgi:hypothetical protein